MKIFVEWSGSAARRSGLIVGYVPDRHGGVLAVIAVDWHLEAVPLRDLTLLGAPAPPNAAPS